MNLNLKVMQSLFYAIFLFLLTARYGIATSGPKKNFIIGVENISYLPFYGYSEGKYTGHARKVLDRFANIYGYKFTYVGLPVKRLFLNLIRGEEIDFKYPDNPNWSKDLKKGHKIVYSQAVVNYIDGIVTHPDLSKLGPNEFSSLGTVLGFTPWGYTDLINSGKIYLTQSVNIEKVLRIAIAKRVEGAYLNISVAKHHLRKMGNENALVFNKNLKYISDSYFLSSLKYPKVVEQFNEFLKKEKVYLEKLKEEFKID